MTDYKLYRVKTAALRDFNLPEKVVAQQVEDLGKFVTTDGMEFDQAGNLYLGDIENSRLVKLSPNQQLTTLVQDPAKLSWPDSYSVSPDGYLYISCSQIQQMPRFHNGKKMSKLLYQVLRLKIK